MDLETRVKNLEDMLASIANTITNNKSYTDADIDGVRHSVSEITPYQETKPHILKILKLYLRMCQAER